LLFRPEDPDDLARAILQQIRKPVILDIPVPVWDDLAASLEGFFLDMTA
jgi:hypothetical protein